MPRDLHQDCPTHPQEERRHVPPGGTPAPTETPVAIIRRSNVELLQGATSPSCRTEERAFASVFAGSSGQVRALAAPAVDEDGQGLASVPHIRIAGRRRGAHAPDAQEQNLRGVRRCHGDRGRELHRRQLEQQGTCAVLRRELAVRPGHPPVLRDGSGMATDVPSGSACAGVPAPGPGPTYPVPPPAPPRPAAGPAAGRPHGP